MELKTKDLVLRPIRVGDETQIHEYAGDQNITMMFWLPNDTFEEIYAKGKRIIFDKHGFGAHGSGRCHGRYPRLCEPPDRRPYC